MSLPGTAGAKRTIVNPAGGNRKRKYSCKTFLSLVRWEVVEKRPKEKVYICTKETSVKFCCSSVRQERGKPAETYRYWVQYRKIGLQWLRDYSITLSILLYTLAVTEKFVPLSWGIFWWKGKRTVKAKYILKVLCFLKSFMSTSEAMIKYYLIWFFIKNCITETHTTKMTKDTNIH